MGSMYDIFTYIYDRDQPNLGKYTIHTWILWVTLEFKSRYFSRGYPPTKRVVVQ